MRNGWLWLAILSNPLELCLSVWLTGHDMDNCTKHYQQTRSDYINHAVHVSRISVPVHTKGLAPILGRSAHAACHRLCVWHRVVGICPQPVLLYCCCPCEWNRSLSRSSRFWLIVLTAGVAEVDCNWKCRNLIDACNAVAELVIPSICSRYAKAKSVCLTKVVRWLELLIENVSTGCGFLLVYSGIGKNGAMPGKTMCSHAQL